MGFVDLVFLLHLQEKKNFHRDHASDVGFNFGIDRRPDERPLFPVSVSLCVMPSGSYCARADDREAAVGSGWLCTAGNERSIKTFIPAEMLESCVERCKCIL